MTNEEGIKEQDLEDLDDIFLAIWNTFSFKLSSSKTLFIKPILNALFASIRSPVRSISIACFLPTVLDNGTIGVEQNNPILTPGVAYFALLLE